MSDDKKTALVKYGHRDLWVRFTDGDDVSFDFAVDQTNGILRVIKVTSGLGDSGIFTGETKEIVFVATPPYSIAYDTEATE
jgi:hypothetical protein